MKILVAGNKERGTACLEALIDAGFDVAAAVAHPFPGATPPVRSFAAAALAKGIPVLSPADINAEESCRALAGQGADLMVLSGYGPILEPSTIALFPRGCINTHAGKLPECRGSSPMNWALIHGWSSFTLSVIEVDAGVDSGPVLLDRTFPIGPDDSIADLQAIANREFPAMLVETLARMKDGRLEKRVQDEARAGYYPLRFPEDGFVLFDQLTAEEIHNRIRALTDPYPGAHSFVNGRRVRLLASRRAKRNVFGEPGRVYEVSANGLLTCAKDRCLWIRKWRFEGETGEIRRYDTFATVRGAAALIYGR